MSREISIRFENLTVDGVLNSSPVADAIWKALPMKGRGDLWGQEFYFTINISPEAGALQEVVEAGDIAYWPPGPALCIFWGRTPASRGDEIRPASPVEVIGRVSGDPSLLKAVRAGGITMTRAEAV